MSKQNIEMMQIGIGKILKDNLLRVPVHQREYSWTKREVQRLFQDLTRAIAENEPEYFLGTIVTIPDKTGAFLEIIDGQQRLATVTILLAQMRNYLRIKQDGFLEASFTHFLEYPDRKARMKVPRLTLNLVDNDFFCKKLANPSQDIAINDQKTSHRLIEEAFSEASQQVANIVAGFDIKDHGDILDKWLTFIEDSAEVILVKSPSRANSFRMLETLNDRGLDMSQADMVKSYLFGEADEGGRLPEAQQAWDSIRKALEPLQQDDDLTVTFLRYALIVIQGITTQEQVYNAVQTRGKGTAKAISFMRQLEGLAGDFSAICQPDHEKWNPYPDSIRKGIRTLAFFGIKPFNPVLLAIASKFEPAEASKTYQMFISVGVRIMVASSTSSGSVESVLHPAANAIFDGRIKTEKELKSAIAQIIPMDDRFRTAFENMTVPRSALARYYLRTLERVAKGEPEAWFILNDDKEIITLEHVLPANPENNWPHFTMEEKANYWRRLGNMVLHSHRANTTLKSASFDVKRDSYRTCPYILTSQVGRLRKWTTGLISKRQKTLAEYAVKAWPI
jgi:hypothetical protein